MANETPKSPRSISIVRDPAYWQALGEFIEAFASAETMLFTYLAVCANIPNSTAKALLSGIHADQIVSLIRRVWEIRPQTSGTTKRLERAFAQLTEINKIRNNVVHYASFVTSDKGRVSSNVTRALTRDRRRLKEFRVSSDILGDMTVDLETISQNLTYALTAIIDPGGISPETAQRELPALDAAWRYTDPEEQNQSHRTPRKRDRN
jgi:hypothetical protein